MRYSEGALKSFSIQVVNGIYITLPKHAKVRLNIEYELVIGCIFPVS